MFGYVILIIITIFVAKSSVMVGYNPRLSACAAKGSLQVWNTSLKSS